MLKKWLPIWVVPMIVVFATGTVWLRLMIVRITYSIGQTDRELERARQDRETLQLKVSALRSPQRLEHLARTKFGLTQPKVEQVIQIRQIKQAAPVRHTADLEKGSNVP